MYMYIVLVVVLVAVVVVPLVYMLLFVDYWRKYAHVCSCCCCRCRCCPVCVHVVVYCLLLFICMLLFVACCHIFLVVCSNCCLFAHIVHSQHLLCAGLSHLNKNEHLSISNICLSKSSTYKRYCLPWKPQHINVTRSGIRCVYTTWNLVI